MVPGFKRRAILKKRESCVGDPGERRPGILPPRDFSSPEGVDCPTRGVKAPVLIIKERSENGEILNKAVNRVLPAVPPDSMPVEIHPQVKPEASQPSSTQGTAAIPTGHPSSYYQWYQACKLRE